MAPFRLTPHDANVLEKIKDPESAAAATAPIQIDDSLPRDPNLSPTEYEAARELETSIITTILHLQRKELTRPPSIQPDDTTSEHRAFNTSLLASWLAVVLRLDKLIERFPDYASALNNRAQALKTLYGDGMLVKVDALRKDNKMFPVDDGLPALDVHSTIGQDGPLKQVARKVVRDLTRGIHLLSPRTVFGAVSSTQAQTLARLYMQRGALYHATAQKLALDGTIGTPSLKLEMGYSASGCFLQASLRIADSQLRESSWTSVQFAENASRDFMMAGRYGDEMGKGLAVSTNPTAKLCGEMVKEAMRKEFRAYGGDGMSRVPQPSVVVLGGVRRKADVQSEYSVRETQRRRHGAEADEIAALRKLGEAMSEDMELDAVD